VTQKGLVEEMSIHQVKHGQTLVIEGPARIVVDDGELTLIGAPLQKGDALVIKKSRHVAIEGIIDSKLKISLGVGAHVDLLNISTIPLEWKELAETLNKRIIPFRAVFFGDVDTGKTTFVTYLANLFYQWGRRAGILSTDLGQGFPGLITLYHLETPIIDMAEIRPTDAFFVGSTTPNNFENRVMIGTQSMLKKAETLGIEALFVDTTGWIYGFKARELKKSLIQLIQPDLIIAVEKGRELEHLIRPFLNSTKVLRMPVSPKIRYRDRTDRKFLRESMLSKQLAGSDTIPFHFKEISFLNSFLNTGEIVSGTMSEKISEIIGYVPKYIELCHDVIIIAEDPEMPLSENIVEKFQEEFPNLPIQLINANIIENVLVGLLDFQNTFLGYGVITNIDFFKHLITIYTPVSKENIASIQFGSFKVTQDGQELCWIHPWSF